MIGRTLAAILAPALLLMGCSERPKRAATPAVWVLRDADTIIYLTGTVHLLPSDVDWRNGPIVQAMTAAQTLATELSPLELDRVAETAPQFLYGPTATPHADRFEPNLRNDFLQHSAKQLPRVATPERLDDWALALMLAQSVASKAGFVGDNGMDNGLIETFRKSGKQQTGLETAADQFGQFDAIPLAEQRVMLNRLMGEIAAGHADDRLRETIDAWARGDADALGAIIARDAAVAPATHRLLLVDRNRRWTAWIARRMDAPGTVLVAVGAGHLVGPGSLREVLTAQGLTPQRLN